MILLGEVFSLEVKEITIVKTEMLKNRTHQSYRWKEIAVSDNKKQLEEYAKNNLHHTQEYRIKSRY